VIGVIVTLTPRDPRAEDVFMDGLEIYNKKRIGRVDRQTLDVLARDGSGKIAAASSAIPRCSCSSLIVLSPKGMRGVGLGGGRSPGRRTRRCGAAAPQRLS
jgi:hypothetical protein